MAKKAFKRLRAAKFVTIYATRDHHDGDRLVAAKGSSKQVRAVDAREIVRFDGKDGRPDGGWSRERPGSERRSSSSSPATPGGTAIEDLAKTLGIKPKTRRLLEDSGYKTLEDLRGATAEGLAEIEGIGLRISQSIIDAVKELGDTDEGDEDEDQDDDE